MKKLSIFFLMVNVAALSSDALAQKALEMFSVRDVRILSGPYRQNETINRKAIEALNPDQLLRSFRINAGLHVDVTCLPLKGWEAPDCDLRGHTMGHYLSALSYEYGLTGDKSVEKKLNYLIEELRKCQVALKTGYLSAFPESKVDYIDKTGDGWAPYYTLHKIFQGLIDSYQATKNETALLMAKEFGNNLIERTSRITDMNSWSYVLDKMEQGGIVESLLNLYNITRDKRLIDAALKFHQYNKLKPAAYNKDILNDRLTSNFNHANTTIPQFIGAIRTYDVTGQRFYLDASRNFWEMVTRHRSYCTGQTSYLEHWNYGPDSLSPELGQQNGESCCTYNMIKLSNDLFCSDPNSRYADYVERALTNYILGSIHQETGNTCYFYHIEPGSFKTFNVNQEVFYCCTGTGYENHVRYGESIYFKHKDSLYVNLYIPSSLTWNEKGLVMIQEQNPLQTQRAKFVIREGTAEATIFLRVPAWCDEGFEVLVDGEKIPALKTVNGYVSLNRMWTKGTAIEVILPMNLRMHSMPDDKSLVWFEYGPLVLAGDLGNEGITNAMVQPANNFYLGVPRENVVNIKLPVLKAGTTCNDMKQTTPLEPEFDLNNFTNSSQPIRLLPLYSIQGRRQIIFWKMN